MMQTLPTRRTAAYAGAWSALGAVPWDQWMSHHLGRQDVLISNLISLCFFAVFLVIPGYFFVIGKNNGVYSRFWFLDPAQRKAYGVISQRMADLRLFFVATQAVSLGSMILASSQRRRTRAGG